MPLTREILEEAFEKLYGKKQVCGHCGKKIFSVEMHECLGEINV